MLRRLLDAVDIRGEGGDDDASVKWKEEVFDRFADDFSDIVKLQVRRWWSLTSDTGAFFIDYGHLMMLSHWRPEKVG